MRIILAIIISLALALQGVANAITAEPPCPMEKGMMMHSAEAHAGMMRAMHMDMADEHDCCNDLETFLKTGQMCKTSQSCGASGTGLLAAMPTFSAVPFTTDFLPDISPSLQSAHPIGVWRPPTFS